MQPVGASLSGCYDASLNGCYGAYRRVTERLLRHRADRQLPTANRQPATNGCYAFSRLRPQSNQPITTVRSASASTTSSTRATS